MCKRWLCGVLILSCLGLVAVSGCGKGSGWLDKKERGNKSVEKALAKKQEGDVPEAIRLYNEALSENPDLAVAHFDLAILMHEYERDYVRAIYHYQRYLELRPETDKREMIETRVRQARQKLAADVFREIVNDVSPGSVDGTIWAATGINKELFDENELLKKDIERLKGELEAVRPGSTGAKPGVVAGKPAPVAAMKPGMVPAAGGPAAQPGVVQKPAPVAAGVQKPVSTTPARTYKVKSGDTLSSIAKKMYGDSQKWRGIQEANKDKLQGSTHLKIGQELIIP